MNSANNESKPIFTWCSIELDNCNYSKRCFMTGEYCSKQERVQRARDELHNSKEISAFVVMNFSNMSDVVYKWRLKSFIESLRNRFFFSTKSKRLYCIDNTAPTKEAKEAIVKKEINECHGVDPVENTNLTEHIAELDKLLAGKQDQTKLFQSVKKINVIRADSDPSSNFVICNRVCQQLQIADLVVVDVSVKNANVFYELGMAVALGKMILPICYSESFYRREAPCDKEKWDRQLQNNPKLEHHIDCFPWRRELFEHFCIRFRKLESNQPDYETATEYLPYAVVTANNSVFSDIKYARFPYNEKNHNSIEIGKTIYNKLSASYNYASREENTVVVYTMDSFLNESQAARCIVNYFNAVVRQFKKMQCFCGERVGVILQSGDIPDDPKDGPHEAPLLYNVGEIIQIGMNQATYRAHMDMIKPTEFLNLKLEKDLPENCQTAWSEYAKIYVKEYIRNRSIPIKSADPVYVKRITDGIQTDLFDNFEPDSTNFPGDDGKLFASRFFCYYHVMLRTLRYTNEIVVDISTNAVQSLFWLGAAHCSDTNAISVRREETEMDRKLLHDSSEKKQRYIFDVAGLWTAVYRSNDTDSFYEQLSRAQAGIDQHSNLILKARPHLAERLYECFWDPSITDSSHLLSDNIIPLWKGKNKQETALLESYYRRRFWKPMLHNNRLRIYVRQDVYKDKQNRARAVLPKWDVDAAGLLSTYLSKRQQIGEYRLISLSSNKKDDEAKYINYICVGDQRGPLSAVSLQEDINSKNNLENNLLSREATPNQGKKPRKCKGWLLKGYESSGPNSDKVVLSQMPHTHCYSCLSNNTVSHKGYIPEVSTPSDVFFDRNVANQKMNEQCSLDCRTCKFDAPSEGDRYHTEISQLVLWCERNFIDNEPDIDSTPYYRAIITGASGPATEALATLFVDDSMKELHIASFRDMKEDKFNLSEDELSHRRFPLTYLQQKIRENLLQKYQEVLRGEIEEAAKKDPNIKSVSEDQLNNYTTCVLYSVSLYLSTVLYRYFLPFLSFEDIDRISNGMKLFTASQRAAKRSPFASQEDYIAQNTENDKMAMPNSIIESAIKLSYSSLRELLYRFRGIEAFYVTTVKTNIDEYKKVSDDDTKDTGSSSFTPYYDMRMVVGIMNLEEKEFLNCLYLKKTSENKGS